VTISVAISIPEANRMEPDLTLGQSDKLTSQQLAEIHDRFYPIVFRYVRYRLDDVQVCEDITSETFLIFLDVLQKRDRSIKNVRAWLMGTASNLINDYLRNTYKRPSDNIDEREIPDHHTPEDAAELAWQQQAIRKALVDLTTEQQNVLALRFSGEHSIEETATLMGKSVGAVKTLQFRALTALKEILNGKRKR
jgi:RNA polymerase sigma-70 factor, ECF subfamily